MDVTPVRNWISLIVLGCSTTCISCETLRAPGSTADWFARNSKSHEREIVSYREKWQEHRDGTATKWMLANRVRNGLTIDEVNSKLGEIGELESGTQEFKQKIDGLRVDDQMYRYGPDRDGEVYYLVFRDGKVVNFDPKRFVAKM